MLLFDAGSKTYVTKIGVDSQGRVIVEERGTGKVYPANSSDLEEVLPYSVSIVFTGNAQVYHYIATKGQVKKDDLLFGGLNFGVIAKVTAVDTKSKAATKSLTEAGFVRIKTEAL